MRIIIEEIAPGQEEEIILRCHEATEEMFQILNQVKLVQQGLIGLQNGKIYRLTLDQIYYFEVVDNKSFFYCAEEVYESRLKLYEFQEISQGSGFFRASKSTILNVDKIDYVAPSFSGRFEVTLLNQEKVIVSRQYVSALKKKMGL